MIIRENFNIGVRNILTPEAKILSVKDNQEEVTKTLKTIGIPDHLVVKVPGTHGGFINDNGFFYTTSGMEIGYHTWVNP
jgi:hypothetical protein